MKAVSGLELPATEGGWSQSCFGDGVAADVAVDEVRWVAVLKVSAAGVRLAKSWVAAAVAAMKMSAERLHTMSNLRCWKVVQGRASKHSAVENYLRWLHG